MMISIRGLTKQFRVSEAEVTALKGLDLDVAEGDFFVIVGASGSGKTTLLRCVAGLERPDQGEIRIGGQVVSSHSPPTWLTPQQRKLGMVFQSYAVWPHMTVFDNVALPLRDGAQRVSGSEVSVRAREALRLAQIEDLANRSATLLSGGQQQRVALARAIAVNSRLLLMDEPLSNLDARLREEVRGKIRELAKRLGATVLYVTHDQVEAMAIADTIALLRLGELLQIGTPSELYRSPRSAEVAEFFGAVNWLKGTMAQSDIAETPVGRLRVEAAAQTGDEVLLGVRPESLSILESPTDHADNVLAASLQSTTFVGDQVLFNALVGDQEMFGKTRSIPANSDGTLRLGIEPSEIMLFSAGTGNALPKTSPVLTGAGKRS